MIKLIACDVDGTMLQKGQTEPSLEMFGLIGQCRERGIRFVVASGRQYPNLRRMFAPVWRDVIFAAENGAVLAEEGQVSVVREIPRDLGLAIIEDIESQPENEVMVNAPHACYISCTNREYSDHLLFRLKNNLAYVEDFRHIQEPFCKISAFAYGEKAALFADRYVERWGGKMHVALAGERWVDFTCASKGTALRRLQEKFAVELCETAAVGDNYNDVEMFKAAGSAWAMVSADQGVKAYGGHVASTAEEAVKMILDSQ